MEEAQKSDHNVLSPEDLFTTTCQKIDGERCVDGSRADEPRDENQSESPPPADDNTRPLCRVVDDLW